MDDSLSRFVLNSHGEQVCCNNYEGLDRNSGTGVTASHFCKDMRMRCTKNTRRSCNRDLLKLVANTGIHSSDFTPSRC